MALGALYKKALPSSINETILHFPPKKERNHFLNTTIRSGPRAENLPLICVEISFIGLDVILLCHLFLVLCGFFNTNSCLVLSTTFWCDMTLSARERTFKTLVTLQHPEGDDRFLKLTQIAMHFLIVLIPSHVQIFYFDNSTQCSITQEKKKISRRLLVSTFKCLPLFLPVKIVHTRL